MPLLDGLGFLRQLRLDDEQLDTPVAIVTGDYFLDDDVLAELKVLGAVLYFKPLWLEDLVALAHRLLQGRHLVIVTTAMFETAGQARKHTRM